MAIRLMIIVGSVRPGRVGLPIARWVEAQAAEHGGFEIDFVDLAELALPFMDEPNHPRLRQYTKQHTIDWSARVDAADAIVIVTPEYNYSVPPALKNALDFLNQEWWRKPFGVVSYGGVSGGTRSSAVLSITTTSLGMVRTGANVEINFPGTRIADGAFAPNEKEVAVLGHMLDDLTPLAEALRPLR